MPLPKNRDTLDRTPPPDSLIGRFSSMPRDEGQTLVRENARRELKYAVQIKKGPNVISVIIVNINIAGGLSPGRIKEQLIQKILSFMDYKWPDHRIMGMSSTVAGRVDYEIP